MKKILITLSGVVFVGAAAVALHLYSSRPNDGQVVENDSTATNTPNEVTVVALPTEDVPATTSIPKYKGQALDFLAPTKNLAKYPAEFVAAQQKKLAGVIDAVNKNPQDETNWIDVGLVKKTFDNFIGARDAWEYAKSISPTAAMTYYNLGKLYSNYLSDNQKAEANFLKVMSLSPETDLSYLALAELYGEFYKEKADQVDDVLLAGVKVLPLDLNLHLQLAFYYKNTGDIANAIKYFEKFLTLPNLAGTQQKAIEEELAALKSLKS